ncbi:MAG: metallophosphoesterase [Victivallales bacterium]|nr:metallophosphoesterase [Victivallales bacterium]
MNYELKRRDFLKMGTGLAALMAMCPGTGLLAAEEETGRPSGQAAFALDGNNLRLQGLGLKKPVKLLVLADSHLSIDDERGIPYQDYSKRMAQYFKQSVPNLEKAASVAKNRKFDMILMLGDMVSFPTAKGVETILEKIQPLETPFAYIAGNHDWHYEGEPGTEIELRKKWTEKTLKPLYQDHNPLCYNVVVNGINIVMMDTSVNEILPEQLDFWRAQVKTGLPMLLCCHIPLWVPGRTTSWGVGHPDWNAEHDKNWEIERRPQWPETSHTEVTRTFQREVFATTNLLGVIAGHVHRQCYDRYCGKFQITVKATGFGGSLDVSLS